jgi:Na+-translocating ferredoxin:NAD+ oxidoreductase subunit G
MKLGASRHSIVLGLFCLGFGILLAATHGVTAGDIASRASEDRLNSLSQVLPAELYDSSPLDHVLELTDGEGKAVKVYRAEKAGQVTGVAYEILGTGYAGEIRLMMAVDATGRILGVRVLAHKETPGLGDKIEAKKGDWILRFTGLSLGQPEEAHWKVKKDGGEFDQFAGATITPRGVVAAVRRGLEFFRVNQARLTEVKS